MTKMVRGAAMAAGLLALAALAALSGCDKPAPDQPVASDNSAVPETNVVEVSNAAAPVTATHDMTTTSTSDAGSREAPPPPDAQTQDDADATGMTSRVNRDQAPANGTAP
jgi:hypothetical protein